MDYDVAKAIERIEDELIYSIMRNLKRHRAEETKEGFNWEMWQVKQLQSLNKFKKDNLKYKPKFAKLNKQIEELLIDMATDGSLDQEKAILEAIKKGYKPPKRSSNKLDATFFKYNSKKLEALISETSKNMAKAETAILRMAHDKYRSIIFDAQMYAATGAGTYEKAVDMATRDFLSAGINCVEYSNGARHTLSNYARMAIRTASKRAYLQGEGEQRKEWGIHTVIVNKRGNPCPKCLPFVGKVLIDDVWSGGSKKDGDYMLMSSAIAAGLYHPNCKDSHTTYFEGLTTSGASFTKQEIKQCEQEYIEDQKRIYAQRQADKYKRLADNSLYIDNKLRYKNKTENWQEETKMLTKKSKNIENNAIIKESIVHGENVVGEWKPRKGKFIDDIYDIVEYQGFDGLPMVVNTTEFEKAIDKDHFVAARAIRGISEKQVAEYIEQLKVGQWYIDCRVGGAQYGKGMYCAADYTKGLNTAGILSEMEHYSSLGNTKYADIVWMTLDESACIFEFEGDTFNLYAEVARKYVDDNLLHFDLTVTDKTENSKAYFTAISKIENRLFHKEINPSILLVEMGYDAINAKGHGNSDSYTVILNRTKTIIWDGKNE